MTYKVILALDLDSALLDFNIDWSEYTYRCKEVFNGKLTNISPHLTVGENGHVEWTWVFKDQKEAMWWMQYGNYYIDVYWRGKRVATEIRLREPQEYDWGHFITPDYDLKLGHRDAGFIADQAKYDQLTKIQAIINLPVTKGKNDKKPTHTIEQKITNGIEKSGMQWVKRYPNNNDLSILKEPFKTGVIAFVSAMKSAGISVSITVVYRPAERTYLMYCSTMIKRGRMSPLNVPKSDSYPNVPYIPIDWAHMTNGKPNEQAARQAAVAMANAYGVGSNKIALPGRSNHIGKNAVDMSISNYIGKRLSDIGGKIHAISSFSDLVKVGATYGVIWFGPKDPPHWSKTGR